MIPLITSELTHDNNPPILLTLNTSKDAKAGDYIIGMAFTYSVGSEVDISRQDVRIHVNSWVERRGKRTFYITLAVTVAVGVISGITAIVLK